MENEFDSEQRICIVNVIQMMQGSMWCSTMGPCGSGLHGVPSRGTVGGRAMAYQGGYVACHTGAWWVI